jgi:hypothetical protein
MTLVVVVGLLDCANTEGSSGIRSSSGSGVCYKDSVVELDCELGCAQELEELKFSGAISGYNIQVRWTN